MYRLQFSDQYQDVDARFIQTNLSIEEARAFAKGRGLRKYRALPDESFERDKANAEAFIKSFPKIGTIGAYAVCRAAAAGRR